MLEIHISWSTWFVVATTNNKRLKKMNFANFRSKYELAAGGAGFAATVDDIKRGKQSIFPILRTFHPSILFGIGTHVHLTTFPHIPHVFSPYLGNATTPNWQKKQLVFYVTATTPNSKMSKKQKKVRTAEKTNLNKDFRDQWMVATDSNSPVLKIKAPVP